MESRQTISNYFNPRSHCRERPGNTGLWITTRIFQSTFPLQGTTLFPVRLYQLCKFQSTFPLQGTTSSYHRILLQQDISIHVPIAGNDMDGIGRSRWPCTYFNPRSHCRERLEYKNTYWTWNIFQSTFPLQGTTCRTGRRRHLGKISIHVPIAGNDSKLIQFLIYNCKIFVLYYSYL